MGIGTLMPHLLGVPVSDGGASAPKADAQKETGKGKGKEKGKGK
jgi:hypothetical protein